MTLKLALFISGRGSNMLSIQKACEAPDFPAKINLVLSNRADAAGLDIAREKGLQTEVVNHKDYNSRVAFDEEVNKRLEKHDVDLIVLAGFMRILSPEFIKKWPERIINIHPSLLPAYKGLHPHQQALDDGAKESGCSVHYVTAELDGGPVIGQRRIPVLSSDTPDTLAARVLEQEHLLYPEVIRQIAEDKA